MPIYTYLCNKENCNHQFDIHRSIKDDFLTECPECKEQSLGLVVYAATAFVKNDPKTIGLLADRNAQKMGSSRLDEIEQQNAYKKELAKEAMREKLAQSLPEGASLPKLVKPTETWYRPDSKTPDISLANLTDRQKEKYIIEGTK